MTFITAGQVPAFNGWIDIHIIFKYIIESCIYGGSGSN